MTVLVSIQQRVAQWQIPPESVAALRVRFPDVEFIYATTDEMRAHGLPRCDVAYTWTLRPDELQAAPRLKWVHTSAVAVETLCVPELVARGVAISNTRGVQAVPIAEHVFAVVLGLSKQLPFLLDQQRRQRWAQNELMGDRLPWLLAGRTLGLVGVGTIGATIASRARAFGMRVVALRRRPGGDTPAGIDQVFGPESKGEFLRRVDVLVIAAPLTPETHHLIGAAELAAMPRGAVLVNVGRALIIDTPALVDALRTGHLGGASLDVFPEEPLPKSHPLWTCPNVILTPHTSGFRAGHWDEVIDVFAGNLERWRRGEPLKYRVDPSLGY